MSDFEMWGDDEDNDPDYVPPDDMENGHITSHDEETDTSDQDEENPGTSGNTEFDTDLPTAHPYLGKMNNVSGYTLYDDGEIVNILAIYTTTLVFPGFTLPLVISNYAETSVMQNYIEKNNVFVLLCANATLSGIFEYGVTMEIYETQFESNTLNIKARGRQRCKLVPGSEIKSWAMSRLKQVTVRILAEPEVTTPLIDTQFGALKRRRQLSSSDYCDIVKNYKYRRYHLAQYPLCSWIYDRNEVCYWVKLILKGLSQYFGEYIPTDPVKLSYWFVQNYQLDHRERLHILKLNSTLERLKWEYKFMKVNRVMCCGACGVDISDQSKVFVMSKEGIQSNYVNPGGHVYETVTVTDAKNFKLEGRPSKQFSWFPGYAWTIMRCKNCPNHLGWKFTSSSLKPNSFYGLAKIGFKIVVHHHGLSEVEEDLAYILPRHLSYTRDYMVEY